jgi:hypothetical protein
MPKMRTSCMLDILEINKTTTTIRFTPSGWRLKSEELVANRNNITGTTVKNLRVDVNWTPSSICSQKVMLQMIKGKETQGERWAGERRSIAGRF